MRNTGKPPSQLSALALALNVAIITYTRARTGHRRSYPLALVISFGEWPFLNTVEGVVQRDLGVVEGGPRDEHGIRVVLMRGGR